MFDWGKIVDSIKLSPRYIFALFLTGLLLLFLPMAFLERTGLVPFRQRFLPYIGAVTLLSGTLLIAHVGAFIVNWFKGKMNLRTMHKSLKCLTIAEKEALRPFIFEDEASRDFAVNDGVAGGLHAKRILYPSSNMGMGFEFPYNMQPWARQYLKKHPKLLR